MVGHNTQNVEEIVSKNQSSLNLENWKRESGLRAIASLAANELLNEPGIWKQRLKDVSRCSEPISVAGVCVAR